MEKFFFLAGSLVVIIWITRVTGVGGIGRVTVEAGVLVQNHQSPNHAGNPCTAGENRHDEYRATTLVQHSQRREDNR